MSDEIKPPDLASIISNFYVDTLNIGLNSAKCIHEIRKCIDRLDPEIGSELVNGPYGQAMDGLLASLEAMQKRYRE